MSTASHPPTPPVGRRDALTAPSPAGARDGRGAKARIPAASSSSSRSAATPETFALSPAGGGAEGADRGEHGPMEAMLGAADIRVVRAGEKCSARAWDIVLKDERLEARVRREGLVGLGDAYVDGWWECGAIDQLFDRVLRAELPRRFRNHPRVLAEWLRQKVLNLQNRRGARRNVEAHYNLGNDVFEATLDPYMQYSCGYWRDADTLAQAQEHKLDLVCRKLGLGARPGMTLLDIGCGWGGLMRFAAERYGARVTGITLSSEQLKFAERLCAPVRDKVDPRLCDYREIEGQFDRVTSIGMFEHVGQKNHRAALAAMRRCVKDDGLALLHTFATRDSFPNRTHSEVNWVEKHIFPGMLVPSLGQIGAAVDGLFVVEDLHNFGAGYDPTLMAWAENFRRNWPRLEEKYGERFGRMWMYYLRKCAGAFRARAYQLWQLVLSPGGVRGGYEAVR